MQGRSKSRFFASANSSTFLCSYRRAASSIARWLMCVSSSVIRLEGWPVCAWTTGNGVPISIVSIRPLANRSSGSPAEQAVVALRFADGYPSRARINISKSKIPQFNTPHSAVVCNDRVPICHHPSVLVSAVVESLSDSSGISARPGDSPDSRNGL